MKCIETTKEWPSVFVLIGTRDRPRPLLRCLDNLLGQDYPRLEVLVLDDCSWEHNICRVLAKQVRDSRVKCFRSEQQLGVAGGRNFLMQKAQGEISVILDDDAIFEDEKCIARVVRHFAQNPNVGILAFKIIDHQNDRVDLLIPFSRRWRKKYPQLSEETRLVSYYLGCHALRREVIERCGLYQDDFMFGGEEFDLSYRVVQAGIDILYCPDVVVHHFPEPSVIGGRSGAGELYYLLRNKFWLAYKYLPLPYIITYLFVRIGDHGVVALRNGQLKEFYQAVKDGISGFKHLRRSPLDKRAIAYLKANFGRLWH